ncbi:MAG TPA: DUF459 domain-containing protein [Acidimicrobiia bacterium]|nr:DUF459 domain-containing protein [Acidimicrobiia bacterium]
MRTRIAVAIVLVALATGAGITAYAVNTSNQDAHAAGPTEPKASNFGNDGTLIPKNVARATPPRALDHAHPLNLWVGGDSLAGLFGPQLGDQAGATGVVRTVIDYKTSSGLWSNDIRNWYQRAQDQMSTYKPDAVAFIIGTNDTPVVNSVDANGDNVPDWEAAYRVKVARMMDLFIGPSHRTVYWLGPPTLGTNSSMDRGAAAMTDVMRQEAARRSPDVVFLDTYKLFSTKDGSFSRRILDENGKEILARLSDGVHFTTDGAAYLARAVFSLIDARWKFTKQADLTQPMGWIFVPGSGEVVPGYSSTPRSRYRPSQNGSGGTGGSNVTATVAPSTVPTVASTVGAPTTTPPTSPVTTSPKVTVPPTTAASPPTSHP